jgi:hypothetical protein
MVAQVGLGPLETIVNVGWSTDTILVIDTGGFRFHDRFGSAPFYNITFPIDEIGQFQLYQTNVKFKIGEEDPPAVNPITKEMLSGLFAWTIQPSHLDFFVTDDEGGVQYIQAARIYVNVTKVEAKLERNAEGELPEEWTIVIRTPEALGTFATGEGTIMYAVWDNEQYETLDEAEADRHIETYPDESDPSGGIDVVVPAWYNEEPDATDFANVMNSIGDRSYIVEAREVLPGEFLSDRIAWFFEGAIWEDKRDFPTVIWPVAEPLPFDEAVEGSYYLEARNNDVGSAPFDPLPAFTVRITVNRKTRAITTNVS